MSQPNLKFKLEAALECIAQTPGYAAVAEDLRQRLRRGKVRVSPALSDRGQASLRGIIFLGKEAIEGDTLGLAETLVHERYHLRQNPFLKTISFWSGVATRTPVMRRYERPAYQAALDFLRAYAKAFPAEAITAGLEAEAVRASYAVHYKEDL